MDAETYAGYQKSFIASLAEYGNGDDPKEETERLIDALSVITNTFTFEPEEIIKMAEENPKAKANLIQLSYEWIEFWDKAPDYRTDGRNELSTKICKKIAAALKEEYGQVAETGEFVGLDREIGGLHKTLVQTATNLFTRVLSENDKAVKDLFEKEYGVKTPDLPLI